MATYPANLTTYYHILQGHAGKVAENTYRHQLAEHIKKGRKKSTFRYKPTAVQQKLVKMSSDVLAGRIPIEEAMGYIAHDHDFRKERYG